MAKRNDAVLTAFFATMGCEGEDDFFEQLNNLAERAKAGNEDCKREVRVVQGLLNMAQGCDQTAKLLASRAENLVDRMNFLREKIRVEGAIAGFNSCGEVQSMGTEVDVLCGKLRAERDAFAQALSIGLGQEKAHKFNVKVEDYRRRVRSEERAAQATAG